jgi:hypothetical protein
MIGTNHQLVMKSLDNKIKAAASDMGFDDPEDMKTFLANHGLVVKMMKDDKIEKFESLSEELKHLRAENERLRNREAKAIQMLKKSGVPEDACPQTLLEWVTAAYNETARLRAELQRYHDAVKYPGTDQRHIGTSVATQLVHAQMMLEKAEKELEKLKQNLFMSKDECKYAKSKGWSAAEYWYHRAMEVENEAEYWHHRAMKADEN